MHHNQHTGKPHRRHQQPMSLFDLHCIVLPSHGSSEPNSDQPVCVNRHALDQTLPDVEGHNVFPTLISVLYCTALYCSCRCQKHVRIKSTWDHGLARLCLPRARLGCQVASWIGSLLCMQNKRACAFEPCGARIPAYSKFFICTLYQKRKNHPQSGFR